MNTTKEELKQFILINRKLHGIVEIGYIPENVLESKDELYGLYYGGSHKLRLGKYLEYRAERIEITDKKIDSIVDTVYELLNNSISEYIHQAFHNFDWEYEELKYFDRDEKKYLKFVKEVLKLKNEKT